MKAPSPGSRSERLASLHRYAVLGTPAEAEFNEITQLAGALCEAPIAAISLVADDRQWLESAVGLDTCEVPIESSICTHAILEGDFVEVPDTLQDARFVDNPLVAGEPHVRFYAGAPLKSPAGHPIGMLCVLDVRPRVLTALQRQALGTLAHQVMARLELKRALQAQSVAAAEIEQARTMLQAVGQATTSLILLKDCQSRMLYCNQALLDALGTTADQVLGKTDAEFAGPGPCTQAMLTHDQQVIESGCPITVEEQFEGLDRLYLSTKAPYRDAHGCIVGLACVLVDITDTRRVEQALSDAEERFRLAAQSSTLGSWEMDLQTRQFHGSPNARRFFGFDPDHAHQPVGNVLDRVHPDDRARVEAAVLAALRPDGSGQYHARYRIVWPDGSLRWIDAVGVARFEGQGSARRAVRFGGVLWDVTDTQALLQELREADARKDEFLATLAHELRNPLAPLRNVASLLKRSQPSAAQRPLLEIMERQVGQLRRLVEDLLEVSRITQGKITLRREPMTVNGAVYAALEAVQPRIEQRAQRLETLVRSSAVIEIDAARITQVVTNLLNNAAKFSPEGGLISLEAFDEPAAVIVRVRDEGIGITPELLPRVFDLFAQGTATTADQAPGGLGIGLSLVKRLVELHGGAVAARSAGPGRGATFTVRLPRQAGPSEQTRADSAT